MAGRVRSFLQDTALVLGVLVILVPVAEFVVRIARPQTLPSQEYIRAFVLKDMYVADEQAGYRLSPNFEGRLERHGHVTEFTTNSLGLRAPEVGPWSADTLRVLTLGDSFTFGWGVPQDETWTHHLGLELTKKLGRPVQAFNGGVNGYGTEGALELLKQIGEEVQPDLVLLGFFANDYTDNLLGAKGIYTVKDGYLFDHFSAAHFEESFLARESHLYRLVTMAWEQFRVQRLGGVPSNRAAKNFSDEEFRRGMELGYGYMTQLHAYCRDQLAAQFVVIWLPADVYAMQRRMPEGVPLRWELQQKVAAAGIPSFDLLPVAAQDNRVQGLYLVNDGHFSVRGNRIAARAISDWIADDEVQAELLRTPEQLEEKRRFLNGPRHRFGYVE